MICLPWVFGEARGSRALGFPKTFHDDLALPDSRKIGAVQSGLVRLFARLGIAGASHEHGRATNVEAYARHLDGIRRQAADKAVADWLATQTKHGAQ
jgi:hypothetical protein